jgi:xylulokinase
MKIESPALNTMGVDLGTTGCRCMVFGELGEVLAESYFEYDLILGESGHVEQSATVWWGLVKKTISACMAVDGIRADTIHALAISSQGISFVPVDREGSPLRNAISWLDRRAGTEAERMRLELGDGPVFTATGKRIDSCYTLLKWLWMKGHEPDLYAKTSMFLMPLEYIGMMLTGDIVTDHSMASGTMAFEVAGRDWSRSILEWSCIERGKLPDAAAAGTRVGRIRRKVAEEIGLSPDTWLILGAQDQKCAAIGAGIASGTATLSLGTSSALGSSHSRPILDAKRRIPCFCLDGTRWMLESVIGTSGAALKWLKTRVFMDTTFQNMHRMAGSVPPGARGLRFYPHLAGAGSPDWWSDASGSFHGLQLSTGREEMVRAVLEGVAMQVRSNLDVQEEIGGEPIDVLRVFGGGASSEPWCRILADVTGRVVSLPHTHEIAAYGAALLAGVGAGLHGDRVHASQESGSEFLRYDPNQKNRRIYDQIYPEYRDLQTRIYGRHA